MYSLLRDVGLRDRLLLEAPAAVLSLVIAEMFFKFGSFSLECVAFLGTWALMGFCLSQFKSLFGQG